MPIFGLGDTAVKESRTSKRAKASKSHSSNLKKGSADKGNTQEDEAKALLENMQAKKDAGNCPFC